MVVGRWWFVASGRLAFSALAIFRADSVLLPFRNPVADIFELVVEFFYLFLPRLTGEHHVVIPVAIFGKTLTGGLSFGRIINEWFMAV